MQMPINILEDAEYDQRQQREDDLVLYEDEMMQLQVYVFQYLYTCIL